MINQGQQSLLGFLSMGANTTRVSTTGSMTMDTCANETSVRILSIAGDETDSLRLREVGVFEGAHVTVITGGNPVILSLWGTRFAINSDLARRISVDYAPEEIPG